MSVAFQLLDVVYKGSCTPSDLIPFDRGFTFNLKRTSNAHDVAVNHSGAQQSIAGDAYYEIKGKMPLAASASANTETAVALLLQNSGFVKNANNGAKCFVYDFLPLTPPASPLALTSYTGKFGTTGTAALVSASSFVAFAPKMTFENGKYGVVDFDGKGVASAIPTIGTYPSTAGTVAQAVYPLTGTIGTTTTAVVTIAGQTYTVNKLDIDFGVEIAVVKSLGGSFGYSNAMIANVKPVTFKGTILADFNDATASTTKNPFKLINDGTPGDFTLTYGDSAIGQHISVSSGAGKCQITDAVPGNSAGIKTMELSGFFIDNSISISIGNME